MLRHLRVLEDNQDFELEIIADHPVVPLTQIVEDPKRLVLDFPGLIPGRDLHGLAVNRPDVTGIRVGLFTSRPPVTRVVLDMNSQPQFELLPSGNSVIVKLAAKDQPSIIGVVTGGVVRPLSTATPAMAAVPAALEAARRLRVSVRAGKLSIWADGATLSDVLYEIHRRTGADIPIPSLARNERVAVNLGPGPAPDVLAALLNGSSFNFVIVGVLGDPSLVSSVQLTQKDNRPQPRFPASPPADAPLDLSTATDSLRQPEPDPLPVSPQPVSDTPPQPLPPPLPPTPDTPPHNRTR